MHRFYAPDLSPGDAHVTLPRAESEHLTRVLRLGAGDAVAVFDGRGREYLATVAAGAGRDVRVEIVRALRAAAEPEVAITLVQAVLKGEKMDDVVRDAVMMGAAAVQPVVTRRSETTVAALARAGRVERWTRVALASAKQCGRAVLPDIRQPLSFEAWLDEPPASLRVLLVEPRADDAGRPTEAVSSLSRGNRPADVAVAIGPEGGWTTEERVAAAARGCRLVTLGTRTLRADAAPVAALAVLQFVWGDL